MARCTGKNARGNPCKAPALLRTKPPRCWAHAKGKTAEQAAAERCRRGGKSRMKQVERPAAAASSPPLRIESQADAVAVANRVANEVWQGKLDPRSANAIIGAVQTVLRPGLLAPSGSFEEFFAQFDHIVQEIDRDMDAGESSSACFGVLKDGTRVLLAGELERAAFERIRSRPTSLEVVGGAAVEPEEFDFEIEPPAEQEAEPDKARERGPRLVIRRQRNPTVPPPDGTSTH